MSDLPKLPGFYSPHEADKLIAQFYATITSDGSRDAMPALPTKSEREAIQNRFRDLTIRARASEDALVDQERVTKALRRLPGYEAKDDRHYLSELGSLPAFAIEHGIDDLIRTGRAKTVPLAPVIYAAARQYAEPARAFLLHVERLLKIDRVVVPPTPEAIERTRTEAEAALSELERAQAEAAARAAKNVADAGRAFADRNAFQWYAHMGIEPVMIGNHPMSPALYLQTQTLQWKQRKPPTPKRR